MVQPIGVAVVGGLTSSTFVTLFFIPVLYSLVMKKKKVNRSKIQVRLSDRAGRSNAGFDITKPNKYSDSMEF